MLRNNLGINYVEIDFLGISPLEGKDYDALSKPQLERSHGKQECFVTKSSLAHISLTPKVIIGLLIMHENVVNAQQLVVS